MLTSMPPELVAIVFQHLHASDDIADARAFTNALCTSRTWRDVGLRLLWTHIALKSPSSIMSFANAPQSTNFDHIQSLTTTIPEQAARYRKVGFSSKLLEDWETVHKKGNAATQILHDALARLRHRFAAMSGLTTFSFYIQAPPHLNFRYGFFVPHDLLFDIVRSLPASVRHLEIDTKGADRPSTEHSTLDVCSAMADRLDVIVSLRLRMHRMCTRFLKASPILQSLVINTIALTAQLQFINVPTMPRPCDKIRGTMCVLLPAHPHALN